MGTETRIPIANIFFMLAYAWDVNLKWERKIVEQDDYDNLWELLARLLVASVDNIFKRGLARDYVLVKETLPGVKGKVDIGRSYKTMAWQNAKAVCLFDDFQSDVILNQIIKATIFRMLKSGKYNLEDKTKFNLKQLYQRFGQITLIENDLIKKLSSIKIPRHQGYYKFALEICRFILLNTVFNEQAGKYNFLDFERDHQKMSALFEHFVFNYYKRHLRLWRVRRENIYWSFEKGGIGYDYLPIMQTDITLEKSDRKVIIDAKFYQEPMKSRFPGSLKKFASANLYQLNAYLTHIATSNSHPCNAHAEGVLLYPVLYPIPRLDVQMLGHRIRVESIDLNQNWKQICVDLENLIGEKY